MESAVTTPEKPKAKREKRFRGFLIRLAIASVIVAFFLCVKYIPSEALDPVRAVLHRIFCFDFFGRTSFGGTPLFAFLSK